ncbi:MAG TPA: phosphoenolpyruvate carboxykinase domain-containing protein, partial [Leptospiraceae bacterium]|nr:phosphoenolpyruvate carboxykinase domain-containing protein [Leptospiraceae bacterium]
RDENKKFLWPGYGENMRVLKWIVERVQGKVSAVESPIGWVPRHEDLDWKGLSFSKDDFNRVMTLDREMWKNEVASHEDLFMKLYDRLPKEFIWMRELLMSSLWRSPETWKASDPT